MKKTLSISLLALLTGCASYSGVSSVTLPSSHVNIDVVMHRSDVRFSDCGTLTVLQTYTAEAKLIDSKEARGQALHCTLLPALIDAGGRVGAGAVVRPARTTISNAVNAAAASSAGASATGGSATATGVGGSGIGIGVGGAGGNGGAGGEGGQGGSNGEHGNNGNGNGDGDGTNPGTDHHHDNGDNS